MSEMPEPGMPVVIVLRAPEPQQWHGKIVALRDASLAIRVATPPAHWNSMLPYAVICGAPGGRFTAPARFVANNATVAAFKIAADWRPLDLRRSPRFATDLKCEVRSILGNSRQAGRVIDVSSGGAAVAVDTKPGGSRVEVVIWANGYTATVLCEVVGTVEAGTETVMRLRFKDLTPPQAAFVRQLVQRLIEAEARAS